MRRPFYACIINGSPAPHNTSRRIICAGNRCLRVALRHALPLMPALLPSPDFLWGYPLLESDTVPKAPPGASPPTLAPERRGRKSFLPPSLDLSRAEQARGYYGGTSACVPRLQWESVV